MRIDFHFRPHIAVLQPQGRLTVETEVHLTRAIGLLHDAGYVRIIVSLEHVPTIDSCGLGALAQAYVSTWSRGGVLKVADVSHRNRRLLTVTGLATVFEVYQTRDEALRSFDSTDSVGDQAPGGSLDIGFGGQEVVL